MNLILDGHHYKYELESLANMFFHENTKEKLLLSVFPVLTMLIPDVMYCAEWNDLFKVKSTASVFLLADA